MLFAFFMINGLLDHFLEYLNYGYMKKNGKYQAIQKELPVFTKNYLPDIEIQYHRSKVICFISILMHIIFFIIIINGGFLFIEKLTVSIINQWHLPSFSQGTIFCSITSLFLSLFCGSYEDIYDFFKTKKKKTAFIEIVLSFFTCLLIINAIYFIIFLMSYASSYWWIVMSLIVLFYRHVITYAVQFISSFYGKNEPIQCSRLIELIDTISKKTNIYFQDKFIFTMKKSFFKENACVERSWRGYKLTITQGLIDMLTEKELEAIIFHEACHAKYHHLRKRSFVVFLVLCLSIGVILGLTRWERLYDALYLSQEKTYHLAVLVGLLFIFSIHWIILPLFWTAQKHEKQADAFAMRLSREPSSIITALEKFHLQDNNDEEFIPHYHHPWHVAFSHTHPPLPNRVRALNFTDHHTFDKA